MTVDAKLRLLTSEDWAAQTGTAVACPTSCPTLCSTHPPLDAPLLSRYQHRQHIQVGRP